MVPEIAQIKRQRILDAALRIFSEKGFHHATMSEVAREAHVGKGTVYLYFDGKESLLVSIFDELVDLMVHIFDQLNVEGAHLRDVVSRMVSQDIESGRTGRQIAQLLAQQPFLSTLSLQNAKQSLVERMVGKVADRIQVAIDDGALRPCDPTLAACVLLNLLGAVSMYSAANPAAGLPESLPHIAEGLADILWAGLRKEDQ